MVMPAKITTIIESTAIRRLRKFLPAHRNSAADRSAMPRPAIYALIPLADVVLEHRVYIAGLGIALLSAALFRWAGKNFRSLRIAVLSIVVVVFAGDRK